LSLREKGESSLSFWEGRGEGEKLAMQEVIAKALFPTAVVRLKTAA
jgi:hypothetical protein